MSDRSLISEAVTRRSGTFVNVASEEDKLKVWLRRGLWGTLGLALSIQIIVWLLPSLLAWVARERVEAILTEALARDVTIEELEVASDAPVVTLRGVEVAQPPGLATPKEGPLLRAEEIRLEIGLDELLDGRVLGLAEVKGVELTVLERGGRTSLHGIGQKPKSSSTSHPALALDLEMREVEVRWVGLDRAEVLAVNLVGGEIRGHLSNRSNADRDAVVTLTAEALEGRGELLRHLLVQMRFSSNAGQSFLELVRVRANVGKHGYLEGYGHVNLDTQDWLFSLELAHAELEGPLRNLAATMVPMLVLATDLAGEATTGWLGVTTDLRGNGLHWEAIEQTIQGQTLLTLKDVVVPAQALILKIAGLAGRKEGPWVMNVNAVLNIKDGWLRAERLELRQLHQGRIESLLPKVEGRVSLKGDLDLSIDLMPFVKRFGGAAYSAMSRVSTTLPVRLTGTIHAPKLAPPRARDVATGLLGGAVRRALTD